MTTIVFIIMAIFFAYTLITCLVFKQVPVSLSDSYYLWEGKRRNLGSIFTFMLWIVAFGLVGPLVEASDGHWWQFTGFLCPAFLGFVGAAPQFKMGMDAKFHKPFAYICAAMAVAYVIAFGNAIVFVPVLFLTAFACVLQYMIVKKVSYTFWFEYAAIAALLCTLLGRLL